MPVLRQAASPARTEHRPRRPSLARRRRLLGEPRDGLPCVQPPQGVEDTRGGQHAACAPSVSAKVDDDSSDPPRKRLEVQGVGAVLEGRELTTTAIVDALTEAW